MVVRGHGGVQDGQDAPLVEWLRVLALLCSSTHVKQQWSDTQACSDTQAWNDTLLCSDTQPQSS